MEDNRKKVIYLDTDKYGLQAMHDRLIANYDVHLTDNCAKLFLLLETITPDLILLDVDMPQVDGYEVIRKLKSNKLYANIPIIILITQNDKNSIIKGVGLGAVDFVNKSVKDSKLIESIKNQLDPEKREAHRSKILAVDDSPSLLKAINYILNNQYKVYTLSEPAKIKELLLRIKPDLFILDYNMPVLNGFQLIPIIRSIPEYEKAPIIILTSEGTLDKMLDAQSFGACDFIVKPINEAVLREKIAFHLIHYVIWQRINTLQ